MSVDIFDLRDVAQELELRNRVYPPESQRELTPIEKAAFSAHYPPGRYELGQFASDAHCARCHESVLTIVDYGGVCRQCRLELTGQDA